jgi:hypothetical protein
MPDLNKFISEFHHGFQHSNRFLVQIFVQPKMIANIIAAGSLLDAVDSTLSVGNVVKWLYTGLLATAARIPDRANLTMNHEMYGLTEKFPTHTAFTKFDVTFMMPHTTNIFNDNGVPRFFNNWQNQIQHLENGVESGLDFRFPEDYYSTILLTLMDSKDRGTITYQFDAAYPFAVDSYPVSWSVDNDYTKLNVQFNFSYWKVLPHLESVVLATVDSLVNKLI